MDTHYMQLAGYLRQKYVKSFGRISFFTDVKIYDTDSLYVMQN